MMTNLQRAIQREIASFAEAITSNGGSIPEVSKAAFCKARKKLKPEIFSKLSDTVIKGYYDEDAGVKLWQNRFRVLACDGSTLELPNSDDIIDEFGVFKVRNDGKKTCMARTLSVYDATNHLTLYGQMANMEKSETELLWEALPQLEVFTNDIFVFDRYYASHLLMFYLNAMGCHYCFRMKKDWWKIVEGFNATGKQSQVIELQLPLKDHKEAQELEITRTKIKVRLVKIKLDSGEDEILLTSLTDAKSVSVTDLKELYGLRWNIEESYKTFKHRVCIENFTGKSVQAVKQDYCLKIFIMNLTAAAVNPINEALSKPLQPVKHIRKVNLTEALSNMRKAVISFFLFQKAEEEIPKVFTRMAKVTEPVRKGRQYPRHHQPKRKYPMGYKPI